jgi:hypothetical protein
LQNKAVLLNISNLIPVGWGGFFSFFLTPSRKNQEIIRGSTGGSQKLTGGTWEYVWLASLASWPPLRKSLKPPQFEVKEIYKIAYS